MRGRGRSRESYLSWYPKPKEWPVDFDRTVTTDTDYGRYLVVAVDAGKDRYRALFDDGTDTILLPQRGESRKAAHRAVKRHQSYHMEVTHA